MKRQEEKLPSGQYESECLGGRVDGVVWILWTGKPLLGQHLSEDLSKVNHGGSFSSMLEHLLVSAIGLKLIQIPLPPLTIFLGIGSCPEHCVDLRGKVLFWRKHYQMKVSRRGPSCGRDLGHGWLIAEQIYSASTCFLAKLERHSVWRTNVCLFSDVTTCS